ncbi:MAG: tRNA (guanosine(46)-N7)-methyltransferase TrmB [Oscillospiraceae bacterium]|jgi:tRNA (guanine-N7-)-methyltransferase|nr:tRNA (guanosine(46)-N7)-methyltransferase TrmB [Oscillospiraceae bacterium]
MRKKKNLKLRWAAVSADRLAEDPAQYRGCWLSLYPPAQALFVELGCGKGRFLCAWAARRPDLLFVGLERTPEALLMAMEKATARGLANVRFICGDAATVCDLFAPGEIDRLFVNFCDPWPSNKRAKRRLTHRNFLRLYRVVLRPEGEMHFKTDNRPLFDFSVSELEAVGARLLLRSVDWHADPAYPGEDVMTEYEEKFSSQGVPICRYAARLGTAAEDTPPV